APAAVVMTGRLGAALMAGVLPAARLPAPQARFARLFAARVEQGFAVVPGVATRGGLTRITAIPAIEQAFQSVTKPMAVPVTATILATTGGDGGSRRRRRCGFFIAPLADQHGPCHQQ